MNDTDAQPNVRAPEVIQTAIDRGIVTAEEGLECVRVREEIAARFGIAYTPGQVLLERLFVANPRLRSQIVTPEGVADLLGGGVSIDFWKFPADVHDRFLERLRNEGLLRTHQLDECFRIQFELSRLGVLKQVGELLVDRGLADRALAEDALRPSPDPERLPCLALDRIAVANGFVAEGAVAAALAKQERIFAELEIHVPIGRVLFETGHLRRAELEAILEAQIEIGRIARPDAELRILKLSRIEEGAMVARLVRGGGLDAAEVEAARDLATKLSAHGLDLSAIEVLWLQDRIPAGLLADVVAYQAENLARLEPNPPAVRMQLAPSASLLVAQCPSDVPEADFLFGQCARIAGAVDAPELEAATAIFRRARRELGLEIRLGQILFDLHGHDPVRRGRLRSALAQLRDDLGHAYEIRFLPLSPLEREVVGERLANADLALSAEIRRAEEAARALEAMGLAKHETEILLLRGALTDRYVGDLMVEREVRDRRLVGGWREWSEGSTSPTAEFFERAFSAEGTMSSWSRPLLGHLAVAEGLVDPPELVRALAIQMEAREHGVPKKIGEVLVELGYLTAEQVEGLLAIQRRRKVEAAALPAPMWVRAEVEFPETLPPEEHRIFQDLVARGVLDATRQRDLLATRAALRGLGLAGSLREILLARGWVQERKAAAPAPKKAPEGPSASVPVPAVSPVGRARPVRSRRMAIGAGAALLVLAVTSFLSLGRDEAPEAVPSTRPAAEAPAPGRPRQEPVRTPPTATRAPEAAPERRGLAASAAPAVADAAVDSAVLDRAAAAWSAPAAVGPQAAGGESRLRAIAGRVQESSGRPGIAVVVETDLPAGAKLVVTLARAERRDVPFASNSVVVDARGRVETLVQTGGAGLARGGYVLAVAYRPETQPARVALEADRAEEASVEVRIDG